MNYNVEEQNDAAVIVLQGNVMGGPDGAKLHETLHELKDKGLKNVVMDLSKVSFMNSSGLGMLISGMTTMRNVGGDLRLATVAERIHSLLVITKLITVFKTYATVEEAVGSYENDPPNEEG